MNTQRQLGERFSLQYLQRGEATRDSQRMRKRFCAMVWQLDIRLQSRLRELIQRELGAEVPYMSGGSNWNIFFNNSELRDILDTIWLCISKLGCSEWTPEIARIFNEENVGYEIDSTGGIHFAQDPEFAAQRASALKVMTSSRYDNTRIQFENSYFAMDAVPPDGKAALRANFSAIEGLFRLIFPDAPRLANDQVDKFLRPLLQANQVTQTERRATEKLINSFCDWIDSAHFYRHEPGTEESAQPSIQFTVLMICNGANWLRWLAEIDQAILAAKK